MNSTPSSSPQGFFARLKAGLSRTAANLSGGIGALLTKKRLDSDMLKGLEDLLAASDTGSKLAHELVENLAKDRFDKEITESEIRQALAASIGAILKPVERTFVPDASKKPFVVLVAGVNGTGKTTTIGKLGARLKREGHSVMMAAGDTFRAAAIEQLKIWGERSGIPVVARAQGSDAASLAFDALKEAQAAGAGVLLIDTAGRLQNKAGLMAELEKLVRVLRKIDASAPHAALLILDATTGQNALSQVEAFKDAVPLSGLVMTKLDGTAKGGILVALAHRFGIPIHFVGVGEGIEDLQPFDAAAFARALTGAD